MTNQKFQKSYRSLYVLILLKSIWGKIKIDRYVAHFRFS